MKLKPGKYSGQTVRQQARQGLILTLTRTSEPARETGVRQRIQHIAPKRIHNLISFRRLE